MTEGTRIEFEIPTRPRPLLDQRIEWAARRGWSLRLRPQDCAALARESSHWLRRGLSKHAMDRIRCAVSSNAAGIRRGARLTVDEVRAISIEEDGVVHS